MARIGIIDLDSRIINLAAMKISTHHKSLGDDVILNPSSPEGLDKTYVSVIFTQNKEKALSLYGNYPAVEFGGTGYSLTVELPQHVESLRPDYDLYTQTDIFPRIASRIATTETKLAKAMEIVDSGIGFSARGCVNNEKTCPWCVAPIKEGRLRQVAEIDDLINPRSNRLILMDNNLTGDPLVIQKLRRMEELKLSVSITCGIDVRRVDDTIAHALSRVKHSGQLAFAWDHPSAENAVLKGAATLMKHIKAYRLMTYCLIGFNSSFDEDLMRVRKLSELGILPYIMIYRNPHVQDVPHASYTNYSMIRAKHFARWVNGKFFKSIRNFNEYSPWVKARAKLPGAFGATQQDLF